MMDAVVVWMEEVVKTFAIALMPVIEIRGAIPAGIAMGLHPALAFVVSALGNLAPVPFLILAVRHVLNFMDQHNILRPLTQFLFTKANNHRDLIAKYGFWGLWILVAIPLPGTGAWTGALVASVLDIRLSKSVPAILLGIISAGAIVMLVTYGVISAASFW